MHACMDLSHTYLGTGVNATMTRIEQRSLHMPVSLDLEFMLSSSGKHILLYVIA